MIMLNKMQEYSPGRSDESYEFAYYFNEPPEKETEDGCTCLADDNSAK